MGGVDPLASALGYLNWPFHIVVAGGNTVSPTSQTIYGAAVYLAPGSAVASIVVNVTTAAAGTTPTGFFVGLATATKMVGQSANLAASAALTTVGPQKFALSAAYVTNAVDSPSGLYYAVFLENGTFGTTQVSVTRQALAVGQGAAVAGGQPSFVTLGTAATVLPANGAAVTLTASNIGVWIACA